VIDALTTLCTSHRTAIFPFFQMLHALEEPIIPATTISREYEAFRASAAGAPLHDTAFDRIMRRTHEVLATHQRLFLTVRRRVAKWEYIEFHSDDMRCRSLSVSEYLEMKERLANGTDTTGGHVLEIDLAPFERGFPRLTQARSIGRGVEFLNRVLSGRLFEKEKAGLDRLVAFLREHQIGGRQLMLGTQIGSAAEAVQQLRLAVDALRAAAPDADDWLDPHVRSLGFEAGWGRTAAQALERMELLLTSSRRPTRGTSSSSWRAFR